MEHSTSAKTWRQKGDWQVYREQRPTGEKREWSKGWVERVRGQKSLSTALNHATNSWIDFGTLKSHGGNDGALFICSFQWAEDGCVCSVHVWLCNPLDYSPAGASVRGIILTRIPEWVAIPFSRRSSWPKDRTWVSCGSCIGRWILHYWATWEALSRRQEGIQTSCSRWRTRWTSARSYNRKLHTRMAPPLRGMRKDPEGKREKSVLIS